MKPQTFITKLLASAIVVLIFWGCVSRKAISEASADKTIVLDTGKHYTPNPGDSYTFYLDHITTRWLPWHLADINKPYYDSIKGFLIKYPALVIEIGYHTDFRGSDEYNDTLSLRIARQITDAFSDPELNPSRIITKGYGERIPLMLKADTFVPVFKAKLPKGACLSAEYINSLPTNNEKEAAHFLNRRFEMSILNTEQ